jgi:hypothetical protein
MNSFSCAVQLSAALLLKVKILRSPWVGLYVLTTVSSAMIEYSLDLDLPDIVFENPIIKAMSDATTDLMTWPNVCRLIDALISGTDIHS